MITQRRTMIREESKDKTTKTEEDDKKREKRYQIVNFIVEIFPHYVLITETSRQCA